MGGKALKGRRLARDEYFTLSELVLRQLKGVFAYVALPTPLRDKASFGDIDILVEAEELPFGWMDKAALAVGGTDLIHAGKTHFHRQKVYAKGETFSCLVSGAQVDFVALPKGALGYAQQWYSHGDTGNFIGLTARAMGLSNHFSGLCMKLEIRPGQVQSVLVCDDFDESLKILGYDPARYREGFDTEQAMFEYVLSSPYFDWRAAEMRNSHMRRRDAQRPQFQRFREYLQSLEVLPEPVCVDKTDVFSRLMESRPDFAARVDAERLAYDNTLAAKERLNGYRFMKVANLERSEKLGMVIKLFNSEFASTRERDAWIARASDSEIDLRIAGALRKMEGRNGQA